MEFENALIKLPSLNFKLVVSLLLFFFLPIAKAQESQMISCASQYGATTIDAIRCEYKRLEKSHALLERHLNPWEFEDWKRVSNMVCSKPYDYEILHEMRIDRLVSIMCINNLSTELLNWIIKK